MTSTRIRWHRPLLVLSFAMALLAVIAAVGLAVDHAGLVGLLLWQALRGQPLIHPDLLTLAAAAPW